MFFTRFLPIIVSVCISAGLWALGMALIPVVGGGYGTLVCDETIPDREIIERLENTGISDAVSESGQWVLLDNFHDIEQVPLDEYEKRLFPFDPRNDNYAEKLRSLFIQDGKRIIYIPITAGKSADNEKKLAAALTDISYSFEYAKQSRPAVFFFFTLFCLAAAAFFVIPPLRRTLRPDAACLIPCLPALAPLALEGAAGFAQASLLAGIAALFAGPCLERLAAKCRQPSRFVSLRQQTRRIPVILPLALLICYGFISFFSGLPLITTALVLVLFCGVFVFSLWNVNGAGYRGPGSIRDFAGGITRDFTAGRKSLFPKWEMRSRQNVEHRRFSPVPILDPPRRLNFAFSWAMLPFAALALALAICGNDLVSNEIVSENLVKDNLVFDKLITEEDYYNHYLFQSTFSVRPLHALDERSGAPSPMSAYEFASDGLPYQIIDVNFGEPAAPEESPLNGVPPFPLGDLIRYLETADEPPQNNNTTQHNVPAALLPLLFILPAFIRGRRSRRGKFTRFVFHAH